MDSRGSSLVEVLLSMAMLSVMVLTSLAVAGFVVTQAERPLEGSEEAINAAQALSDALRNYVAADWSKEVAGYAPVDPRLSADPEDPTANRSWKLPGDDEAGCEYALAAENVCPEHDGSYFLSSRLLERHPGASLSYAVSGGKSPDDPLKVTFTVKWNQ